MKKENFIFLIVLFFTINCGVPEYVILGEMAEICEVLPDRPGDCQQFICEDNVNVTIADLTDYDDYNICTLDYCELSDDGKAISTHEPLVEKRCQHCNQKNGHCLCNQFGNCVECLIDEHCPRDQQGNLVSLCVNFKCEEI